MTLNDEKLSGDILDLHTEVCTGGRMWLITLVPLAGTLRVQVCQASAQVSDSQTQPQGKSQAAVTTVYL